MAKKSEQAEGDEPQGGDISGGAQPNAWTRDTLMEHIAKIEELEAEIESEKGSYMEYCREKREEIKSAIESAKNKDGIPMGELKSALKIRKLSRKMDKEIAKSEGDTLKLIIQTIGGLAEMPLGKWAIESHQKA